MFEVIPVLATLIVLAIVVIVCLDAYQYLDLQRRLKKERERTHNSTKKVKS